MQPCFLPADILLPIKGTDIERWAVVACDQFTSQPDYWQRAEAYVGDAPSTLRLIYPEAYLSEGDARIERIRRAMEEVLASGTLCERVSNGFVLVCRQTESGERWGLVGKLDLEQYDYTPGAQAPVRATEGTILSRIPPRVKIRQGAPIESPHVMMLVDDPQDALMAPLKAKTAALPKLYDTPLMQGGGHIRGWAVEGAAAEETARRIDEMQAASDGFFLAAGDGNHSLATAKACWEALKPSLSPEERETHPARYALVEVVSLHSTALIFQPIHRALFGAKLRETTEDFAAWLERQGMALVPGEEVRFAQAGEMHAFAIEGRGDRLPLDVLQRYLDALLTQNAALTIDYVHGEEETLALSKDGGALAILVQGIPKDGFFSAIRAGGVLPRKTFSMGEGHEKRYYMECRRIL